MIQVKSEIIKIIQIIIRYVFSISKKYILVLIFTLHTQNQLPNVSRKA